ncbi:MAG: hypothetical protein R3D01_11635 [Hyphomicrobiales bacterium]
MKGVGVSADRTEAVKWIRESAKHNLEQAIETLRKLGEPVPPPETSEAESTTGTGGLTTEDLGKLD